MKHYKKSILKKKQFPNQTQQLMTENHALKSEILELRENRIIIKAPTS